MNMGDYDTGDPNEAVKTAAHEYGHLLGIPDEYSQSNAQMHKLMHQASPTLAAGEDQKLDDAATKYMVLRAMGPSWPSTPGRVRPGPRRRSARSARTSSRRCGRRSPVCGRTLG